MWHFKLILVRWNAWFYVALVFQVNQVWANPRWSTVCSSPICTKTESCSTQKVSQQSVTPNTRRPHQRLQTCCMFLTCRANQSDGGDHQAHGGHRGEGREAEADHRGHPWLRRRCRQQRVVRSHFARFKIQLWQHFLNSYSGKFRKWETLEINQIGITVLWNM